MNSLSDEELLSAWNSFCDRYEKLSQELNPLLQKLNNLELEKKSLIEEFLKRGVEIKNEAKS